MHHGDTEGTEDKCLAREARAILPFSVISVSPW
jgi:hypothetical protein